MYVVCYICDFSMLDLEVEAADSFQLLYRIIGIITVAIIITAIASYNNSYYI